MTKHSNTALPQKPKATITTRKKHATKPQAKIVSTRTHAMLALQKVLQGQSLQQVFAPTLQRVQDIDKGFFHQLLFGTLRYWFMLKPSIVKRCDSSKGIDDATLIALQLGFYQLFILKTPHHAALNETVNATKQFQPYSANFVNALLRRALGEYQQITAEIEQCYPWPQWMYKQLHNQWVLQLEPLKQQALAEPPIFLRINTRLRNVEGFIAALQHQNIQTESTLTTNCLKLISQTAIDKIVGYPQGWFSVQDQNAQQLQYFLPNLDYKMVLDACAAPGGKTALMLEHYKPSTLLALDIDTKRINTTKDNIARLQLLQPHVLLKQQNALEHTPTQPYDFILLDAPCTASGVARRHPDMLLLRKANDLNQTVQLQQQLLNHLWQYVKVGGHLLYITCSIFKQENQQQISQFLQHHPNAQLTDVQLPESVTRSIADNSMGVQFLPTQNGGDGLYYALMQKVMD